MRTSTMLLSFLATVSVAAAQAPPPGEGLLHALYVDVQGLGPTGVPGSITCDDSRPRGANTISTPWCSLTNGAFAKVLPGDIVYVRAGTYNHIGSGAQSGYPKYALGVTRRGSPSNHIWYSNYPGEHPVIVPHNPDGGPANCTQTGGGSNTFTGCQWMGLGLMPVGWLGADDGTCYSAPNTWTKGGACSADADCGGTVGTCHRNSVDCTGGKACRYYVTVNGLHFQHWNYWDNRIGIAPASARLTYYATAFESAYGSPSAFTVQGCELDDNSNVFFTNRADGLTFQYNYAHDNHLHGWTSVVNLYHMRGALGSQNVVRGNIIANNSDTPPPWCLRQVCSGGTNTCFDHINGYGNGCTCMVNANCQSGVCQPNAGDGSCDGILPYNDALSEGNGIIVDTPDGICKPGSAKAGQYCTYAADPFCGDTSSCQMSRAGVALMEDNIIYNNYGGCINLTRAQNINFRNNTCYHNNLKHRPEQDGELIAFGGGQIHNNIFIPSDLGSCRCSKDADCGGPHAHCVKTTGSMYGICRTGTLSTCTQDSECPLTDGTSGFPVAQLCVPSRAVHGYFGGASNTSTRWPWTFYLGDTSMGGNLAWNTMAGGSHALWATEPSAIAMMYTTPGFKTATTIKQCAGGSRNHQSCLTLGDCPGGSACSQQIMGATDNVPVTWGWAGNGASIANVSADPLFVNAPADFSLSAGSPAIAAGDPAHRAQSDQLHRSWITTDIGALAFGASRTGTTPLPPVLLSVSPIP